MNSVNIERQYTLAKLIATGSLTYTAPVATGTTYSAVITAPSFDGGRVGYEQIIVARISSFTANFNLSIYNIRTVGGETADSYVDGAQYAKNSAQDKRTQGMWAGCLYSKLEFSPDVLESAGNAKVFWEVYDIG